MTPEQIATLMVGLGVGGILLELAKRLFDALTGRGRKRRDEISRAWDRTDQERRRADEESRRKRIAEEHASHCRRLLLEAPCVPNETIPPYPTYE